MSAKHAIRFANKDKNRPTKGCLMFRYQQLAAAIAIGSLSGLAQAESTLEERLAAAESRLASLEKESTVEDRVQINGFMTFAMEKTSNVKDAAGNSLYFQNEVGNDDWSLDRLTRAGVQFNGKISDKAEAVVQVLGRADDNFDAQIKWAYVGYDINNSLTARAGRLMLPFYLHSQYTQVGYAYPWIELPTEMYAVIPLDTMEGIDLTWNVSTGNIAHSINVFWGGMDVESNGALFEVRDQHGINLRSNLGNWTAWYSYTNSEVSVDVSANVPVPPFPAALQNGLNMDHHYAYFTGLGLQYDNGSLFVMAERGRLDLSTPAHWFPTLDSGYVTAGYRFGKFTPHVTWAGIEHSDLSDVDTNNPLAPVALGLFQTFGDHQKSWTFGSRYDLTPGISLKAEVTYAYDFSGDDFKSNGFFSDPTNPTNLASPDTRDDDPMIYRLAVETVF
jgi:hypothetical protein